MTENQGNASPQPLQRTPLHALHVELGARMVPFAGYEMPVQYAAGVIKEHLHTREAAGLFDVSHMGQAVLTAGSHERAAAALEALVPADIAGLKPCQQRYTQLLNETGGIIDDLIVTRLPGPEGEGALMLVVNAARKAVAYAHIHAHLPRGVTLTVAEDRALLALQGPEAAAVIAGLCPKALSLAFMSACLAGSDYYISRSGYTGEDGFEISLPAAETERAARWLLEHPSVKPIGLGARDTLRLEAGLCLYGHDINETTSPVEAGLAWSIGKARRQTGSFLGAGRVLAELREGVARKRIGIRLDGRAPAREGCEILSASGEPVGKVTSGSFAPSLGVPVAMGYVATAHATAGTPLQIVIRGTPHPAHAATLPFVPYRYHRNS